MARPMLENEKPTPVQAAAIPVGLEGADLLAQAQTGTGKTGTFGSIILSRTKSGSSDPTSLVLVPTRELASQVSEEMERLSEYSGHVCIPIYGGVNIETQAKQLKKGADAVIATPGRLKDLIERKMIRLDSLNKGSFWILPFFAVFINLLRYTVNSCCISS